MTTRSTNMALPSPTKWFPYTSPEKPIKSCSSPAGARIIQTYFRTSRHGMQRQPALRTTIHTRSPGTQATLQHPEKRQRFSIIGTQRRAGGESRGTGGSPILTSLVGHKKLLFALACMLRICTPLRAVKFAALTTHVFAKGRRRGTGPHYCGITKKLSCTYTYNKRAAVQKQESTSRGSYVAAPQQRRPLTGFLQDG